MGKSKTKTKRKKRRRGREPSRKKGGVMVGMRSGFKGITDSVTGTESSGKYKWWGRIITVLLVAAAVGLLAQRL
jgi:hypothetical protein